MKKAVIKKVQCDFFPFSFLFLILHLSPCVSLKDFAAIQRYEERAAKVFFFTANTAACISPNAYSFQSSRQSHSICSAWACLLDIWCLRWFLWLHLSLKWKCSRCLVHYFILTLWEQILCAAFRGDCNQNIVAMPCDTLIPNKSW